MSGVEIPNDVAIDELLGRRVSSSREARRAERNVRAGVFDPGEGMTRISVDRLSVAPSSEITEIAREHDRNRKRTFYGWAAIGVKSASANGRRVVATPIPEVNLYHADIELPDDVANDEYQRARHLQQLADASSWRAVEPSE